MCVTITGFDAMSETSASPHGPVGVESLAQWLRCPSCGHDLAAVERLTLGCTNGHRFDVNKKGYVSLLRGGTKLVGDDAGMLDARDLVQQSETFAELAGIVADNALGRRILDAGAGTGFYLRAALARSTDRLGLAMDLSPAAVARAVRSSDRIAGLVADTWKPIPVRSQAADTVLNIFAPRNLAEFHRVLRPDGTLIVVVPRADHLHELRASVAMLDVPADKADDVAAAAAPLFDQEKREHFSAGLRLDARLATALVEMGPSARHASAVAPGGAPDTGVSVPRSTTISVDVLTFRRG